MAGSILCVLRDEDNKDNGITEGIKLMHSRIVVVAVFGFLLTGCATSGIFNSANVTNVELSEGNYELVATNVSGHSSAGYLIGFSWAYRAEPRTLALLRVDGDEMLVNAAMEDLWASFGAEHGSPAGRKLALVNVRFDSDAANYLGLYTQQNVTIRADVVEFGR